MPSNADVVTAARSMIGTRWRHQGRDAQHGVDCIGLIVVVGRRLGLLDFDTLAYQRDAAANHFYRYFQQHGSELPINRLRSGCVVVLQESRYPCHCGIVAERDDRPTLIHAYAKRRKVVEELLTRDWFGRIVGAFQYRGIDCG